MGILVLVAICSGLFQCPPMCTAVGLCNMSIGTCGSRRVTLPLRSLPMCMAISPCDMAIGLRIDPLIGFGTRGLICLSWPTNSFVCGFHPSCFSQFVRALCACKVRSSSASGSASMQGVPSGKRCECDRQSCCAARVLYKPVHRTVPFFGCVAFKGS